MKKILLFLMLFLAVPAMAEKLTLVVLGDSLSAGHLLNTKESFGSQLDAALKEKGYTSARVINYSFSGATTADGARRLRTVLGRKPDGVILQLGANDMLRQLDLAQAKQNLQSIISTLNQKGIPVLLVGMEASVDLPEEYRSSFRQMYADLALDNELLLYPFFMQGLWNDDGSHVSEEYFVQDKMHPSAKGVAVMVKNIMPAVQQFIAEDIEEPKEESKEEKTEKSEKDK